jgi:ADP-heptose:LPS heptosyltransferase
MRILIVKLGSIGDVVHTLPALAALRAGLPQAEISWVVERNASEILKDNPLLDRLIEVDTKALRRGLMSGETLRAPRQQLRRLRASAFDVALDFQGLLKSASIARLSGASYFWLLPRRLTRTRQCFPSFKTSLRSQAYTRNFQGSRAGKERSRPSCADQSGRFGVSDSGQPPRPGSG